MATAAELKQSLLQAVLKEEAPQPTVITETKVEVAPPDPAVTDVHPHPEVKSIPPNDDGTDAISGMLDNDEPVNFETDTTAGQLPPPPEEDPLLEDPIDGKEPPQQSFANLRNLYKQEKKDREAAAKRAEELEARIAKFEIGEEIPEPLKDVHARVTELEHYQALVGLKSNPQYDKEVLEPLTQNKEKLLELAKAYNVPPEKLKPILENKDIKFRNSSLSSLLRDPVAVLEAKNIINSIDGLEATQSQFEKAPREALDQMVQREKETRDANARERLGAVKGRSSSAWVKSLNDIRSEGKILELIPQDGNKAHNEKWVKPIVEKAAKQYGLIVKALVQAGLRDLPEDAAYAIARAVQQAYAAGSSSESRRIAMDEADRAAESAQRRTVYERPPIGAGGSGAAAPRFAPQSNLKQSMEALKTQVLKG